MCLKCEEKRSDLKGPAMKDIVPDSVIVVPEVEKETEEGIAEESQINAEQTIVPFSDPDGPSGPTRSSYAVFLTELPALNIRSGPGTNHALIGSAPTGSIIETLPASSGLDRTPTTWNGGFGWVQLTGGNGWVGGWPGGTDFSTAGNGNLWAAHHNSYQTTISVPSANIRIGPGTEFNTTQIGHLMSLPQGTRIGVTHFVTRSSLPWSHSIPSTDPAQAWVRITHITTTAGTAISGNAWVNASLIEQLPSALVVRPPLVDAPRSVSETRVVMTPTLNIRSGAGLHHGIIGQAQGGQISTITQTQFNRTEDRTWIRFGSGWVARENTRLVENYSGHNFHVSAEWSNVRNAPDVEGTTILRTVLRGTVLRTTHRLRTGGTWDWFRFSQTINGQQVTAWIAGLNGFIEGAIGSPGLPMLPNAQHPYPRIDSRPVSLRNPNYNPSNPNGSTRPFYATRLRSNISQIVIHHTAGPANQSRLDIEAGWRGMGWWNGGYHEMIHANGTVELCYNPEVVANGVFGHNGHSYHIAFIGHTNPTPAQRRALITRTNFWQRELNVSISQVFGHGQLTPTLCPGMDMNRFRSDLSGGSSSGSSLSDSDVSSINHRAQTLTREMLPVLGVNILPGTNLLAINFIPSITGTPQYTPTVVLTPVLMRAKIQEAYRTSSGFDMEIRNGVVQPNSNVDELIISAIRTVNPSAGVITLENLKSRIAHILPNGSASLSFEVSGGRVWLQLKFALQHVLPSGNSFNFELAVQISVLSPDLDGNNPFTLPAHQAQEAEAAHRRVINELTRVLATLAIGGTLVFLALKFGGFAIAGKMILRLIQDPRIPEALSWASGELNALFARHGFPNVRFVF